MAATAQLDIRDGDRGDGYASPRAREHRAHYAEYAAEIEIRQQQGGEAMEAGEFEAAVGEYTVLLDAVEKAYAPVDALHAEVARAATLLADALFAADDHASAMDMYERAVAVYDQKGVAAKGGAPYSFEAAVAPPPEGWPPPQIEISRSPDAADLSEPDAYTHAEYLHATSNLAYCVYFSALQEPKFSPERVAALARAAGYYEGLLASCEHDGQTQDALCNLGSLRLAQGLYGDAVAILSKALAVARSLRRRRRGKSDGGDDGGGDDDDEDDEEEEKEEEEATGSPRVSSPTKPNFAELHVSEVAQKLAAAERKYNRSVMARAHAVIYAAYRRFRRASLAELAAAYLRRVCRGGLTRQRLQHGSPQAPDTPDDCATSAPDPLRRRLKELLHDGTVAALRGDNDMAYSCFHLGVEVCEGIWGDVPPTASIPYDAVRVHTALAEMCVQVGEEEEEKDAVVHYRKAVERHEACFGVGRKAGTYNIAAPPRRSNGAAGALVAWDASRRGQHLARFTGTHCAWAEGDSFHYYEHLAALYSMAHCYVSAARRQRPYTAARHEFMKKAEAGFRRFLNAAEDDTQTLGALMGLGALHLSMREYGSAVQVLTKAAAVAVPEEAEPAPAPVLSFATFSAERRRSRLCSAVSLGAGRGATAAKAGALPSFLLDMPGYEAVVAKRDDALRRQAKFQSSRAQVTIVCWLRRTGWLARVRNALSPNEESFFIADSPADGDLPTPESAADAGPEEAADLEEAAEEECEETAAEETAAPALPRRRSVAEQEESEQDMIYDEEYVLRKEIEAAAARAAEALLKQCLASRSAAFKATLERQASAQVEADVSARGQKTSSATRTVVAEERLGRKELAHYEAAVWEGLLAKESTARRRAPYRAKVLPRPAREHPAAAGRRWHCHDCRRANPALRPVVGKPLPQTPGGAKNCASCGSVPLAPLPQRAQSPPDKTLLLCGASQRARPRRVSKSKRKPRRLSQRPVLQKDVAALLCAEEEVARRQVVSDEAQVFHVVSRVAAAERRQAEFQARAFAEAQAIMVDHRAGVRVMFEEERAGRKVRDAALIPAPTLDTARHAELFVKASTLLGELRTVVGIDAPALPTLAATHPRTRKKARRVSCAAPSRKRALSPLADVKRPPTAPQAGRHVAFHDGDGPTAPPRCTTPLDGAAAQGALSVRSALGSRGSSRGRAATGSRGSSRGGGGGAACPAPLRPLGVVPLAELYQKICDETGIPPLREALRAFNQTSVEVHTIDLNGTTGVTAPASFKTFLQVLSCVRGLRVLRLAGTGLCDHHVNALCVAVDRCVPSLTEVDLSRNPGVGAASGRALGQLLLTAPRLVQVNLDRTGVPVVLRSRVLAQAACNADLAGGHDPTAYYLLAAPPRPAVGMPTL
eukprot:TRINITY_DN32399_c0_g1_i1.p1 TRINITY_DN32399_c0_g1~~TRINITY_DN32399_c0_g1_i1.p1  ORF type:complete len:1412 (+),score=303.79 TRINITY_DN32399_c0_g1_i1:69-4238(+)